MGPFTYQVPASLEAAIALLAGHAGTALPLAGGTDLIVQLRHRLRAADTVVDVKQIPELTERSFDPGVGLTVGAAVSCARLCEHPAVQRHYPALADAASIIGGPAIRERATLGGNLCNAAPSGDTIPAMIVLGAVCTIAGLSGTRTLPVEDVCTGPGQSVLAPAELLVRIQFPPPTPGFGARYLRFIPRGEMDIAVAGAGASVRLNEDQTRILDARIALAAVAPTPLLAASASAALAGQPPTEDLFAKAAQLAQEAASPISDARGTAAQRRHLVGVLVRRALHDAVRRAKGAGIDG